MSVTTSNLVMGPATIYFGAFGATEPDPTNINTTPAASAWTDLGGTMDGAEWSISQTYTDLQVDQLVDKVGARLTGRDVQLTTNLAEITLSNLAFILNDGTTASGANYKTYTPNFATSATQPTYHALLMDGFGPNQERRRVIMRRCLSTKGTKIPYSKSKQTMTPVTWDAYYVSNSIASFVIIDEAD
jgi:hypothetical protein